MLAFARLLSSRFIRAMTMTDTCTGALGEVVNYHLDVKNLCVPVSDSNTSVLSIERVQN